MGKFRFWFLFQSPPDDKEASTISTLSMADTDDISQLQPQWAEKAKPSLDRNSSTGSLDQQDNSDSLNHSSSLDQLTDEEDRLHRKQVKNFNKGFNQRKI